MSGDLLGRIVFLRLGEGVDLRDGAGNPADTRASKSTDGEVAFLVSLEHKTIYHIGDSNNRAREGEPEADSRRVNESLHRGMGKLAGRHIGVAFMLTDPRWEKDFYLGMDDFMRMVGTDMVFPMHFREDFQATARFKALTCASGYKNRIQEIHRWGEKFLV